LDTFNADFLSGECIDLLILPLRACNEELMSDETGLVDPSLTSGPNGAVLLALSFVTCFTILLEGEGEPSCPFH